MMDLFLEGRQQYVLSRGYLTRGARVRPRAP